MDVIPGILAEEEVLDMPSDALAALAKLFSASINSYILEYEKNQLANPEVKEKLSTCIGESLDRNTFHIQVADSKVRELINQNNLRELPMLVYNSEVDLDMLIEQLTWLDNNEGKLQATLPKRTKDDFDVAVKLVSDFQADSGKRHLHNLPALLVAHKSTLFCPPKKAEQSTGMRSLITGKNRWRMQLKAALYLKKCRDAGISYNIMREC